MTIQRRLAIVAAMLVFAFILYGAAKYYSPLLVDYVVEQSLLQKAPAGIDPAQLRERLHLYLSTAPDKNRRMELLFFISGYLEKVQHLTPEEVKELLPVP
jgi:hypothetical protein